VSAKGYAYGISAAEAPIASLANAQANTLMSSSTKASATSLKASVQTEGGIKHHHHHHAGLKEVPVAKPAAIPIVNAPVKPVRPVMINPRPSGHFGAGYGGFSGWFPYAPVVAAKPLPSVFSWIPEAYVPDVAFTLMACDVYRYPNYFGGRCFAECPPLTTFTDGRCLVQ
jgi:hypothetical protein